MNRDVIMRTCHQSEPKKQPCSESGKPPMEDRVVYVMEDISKFVSIFITIYLILIFCQYSEMDSYIVEQGGSLNYWEFFWIIPGIIFSYGLYYVSTRYFAKYLQPWLTKVNFKEGEDEAQRIHRVGVNIMGLTYYCVSFCWLFYLGYKDRRFLPRVFGGELQLEGSDLEWPLNTPKFARIVYLGGLGHHLERLLVHAWEHRHSKTFHTMNLHHLLTVFLIALSYFLNHFLFGIAVFLLHDFTDALLWASRLLRETVFEKTTVTCFILMAVGWFFTRIGSFLIEVIFPLLKMLTFPRKVFKEFYFTHLFFFTALGLLAVLNIYWFFQIAQIAITKFIKKKNSFGFEDSAGRKKKN